MAPGPEPAPARARRHGPPPGLAASGAVVLLVVTSSAGLRGPVPARARRPPRAATPAGPGAEAVRVGGPPPGPRSARGPPALHPRAGAGRGGLPRGWAPRARPQLRPPRSERGFPRAAELGARTPASRPRPRGARLTSRSFPCTMTTPQPGPAEPPGDPAWTPQPQPPPPGAPDLRVFALVAVELSGFAPGQESPAGPRCPGGRLRGCGRRRWRRLRLLVVHDQRARAAGCRLHLGCSTPPAQLPGGVWPPLSRDFFQGRSAAAILGVAASAEAILAAQRFARCPRLEIFTFFGPSSFHFISVPA